MSRNFSPVQGGKNLKRLFSGLPRFEKKKLKDQVFFLKKESSSKEVEDEGLRGIVQGKIENNEPYRFYNKQINCTRFKKIKKKEIVRTPLFSFINPPFLSRSQ